MLERICKGFSRRVTALLLAVCMVFTMSPPVTAAGATDSGEIVLLSGFAALAEDVREQSVPIGTSSVELNLPDTLEATAEQTAEAKALGLSSGNFEQPPETVTVSGVTWQSDPLYDGEMEGEYTFTAVLPDGYTVEEGVSLPEIAVTVGQPMLRASRAAMDYGTNCTWEITADGVLTIAPKDGNGGILPEFPDRVGSRPWYDLQDTIKKVVVEDGVKSGESLESFLMGLVFCTEIDLTGLDTSAATDMNRMFHGNHVKTITFGEKFTTENVTNMSNMFSYCSHLTSLDLSKFNTANVTNMSGMFSNCRISSGDVYQTFTFGANFDTSNVTDMSDMFNNCDYLPTLDLSGFDTAKVTDMSHMFQGCTQLAELTLDESFNTTKVTDMTWMFWGCDELTSLDVSNFDTSNVKSMSGMFQLCLGLTTLNVSNFDTSSVENMSTMFTGLNLTTLDVSNFNTAKVTDMSGMFSANYNMDSLDVSMFDTSNVKNMSAMFQLCTGLTTLNVSEFDTSKVTDMSNMFNGCTGLTTLDVSKLDTSNVKNMSGMFNGCTELTTLDVSMFDTSNVTDMSDLFKDCTGLTTLDVSKLNTAKVTSMSSMFMGCTGLTTLDLTTFACTLNVSTGSMFYDCSKLETVKFPQATQLGYLCFYGCNALTSLTMGAAPPIVDEAFYFTVVEGGKSGLVLAQPDGTPLTESTTPKLSAAVADYKAVDDGDTTDNLWYGWQVKAIPLLPAEATPSIAIDYASEKLTGFASGGSYTVNGTAVSPAADGTLAIDTGRFGTTVSIVKKASDTTTHTDSAAQTLAIPARPTAPAAPGKTDETVGGLNDGKLTGLTANTSYQLSADNGTTWTTKTADSTGAIIGLAPGSYTLRIPATSSNFAGTSTAPVTIASGPKADISAKLTVTIGGWAYGDTAKAPSVAATGITLDQSKAAYTYSGTANDGTTLTSSTTAPTKTGSYSVTAKYEDDTQKGTATVNFTVAKAQLTITGGTVTTRGYTAGDKSATVTAVTFGGLKNGETLAITTDYTVTGAEFADANVGTNKPVTATVALKPTAKTANYTLSNSQLNTTGTITQETDGTKNPDYADALAELNKVHIITNVTPTLGDVTLPVGWSFTGDKTAKLVAHNGNGGKQSFAVLYTSQNPNYPDVAIAAQAFPVSTVSVTMSKLEVVVIDAIGGTESLSATATVIGAPLTGDLAVADMEWRSSCPEIVSLSGASMGSTASITAKGDKKGVSMVGVAYKGGDMLGYVLVKVVDNSDNSANTIDQIKDIADTLDKLMNKDNPTAGDKDAVNAVADEVTKLPESAKISLMEADIKPLDELKQAVNSGDLTIHVDQTAQGNPPVPQGVAVTGTAIACGVDTGTVTYYVTPVAPTGTDTKLELKLEMDVDGSKEQLKAPLFFTMTLPGSVDVSKLKIKHVMENGSEDVSFTSSGQTVSFKLNSFSELQFVVTGSGTIIPPPGGEEGGSGGSSDDGYDFWMNVKDKIEKADDGDVIKANAKDYDKLPESVMDELRKNPDVTLVIDWNGGKTITIPAGKAQKKEPGRIYWPLSKLAELYAGIGEDTVMKLEPQNPETGGPGKYIPITGGELITLEAPTTAVENAIPGTTENAQAFAPTQPKAITPPNAGFEADAFGDTPDAKATRGTNGTVIAGFMMLLVVLCGSGFWFLKRKMDRH